MPRDNQHAFLMEVLKGDYLAVDFCESIFRVSQLLDDMVDRDKAVSNDMIVEAFWRALIQIPNNEFYRRNFDTLNPMLRAMLVDWLDANTLEATKDAHDRSIAFVLRDSIGAIAIHAAFLVGGYAWGRQVSADIRRHIFEETLEDYQRGLEQ